MAFDPTKSKFNIQVYGKQVMKPGRKFIIYGMFGVGKTTLAATWPSPLFIDTDFGENTKLVELGIPYLTPRKTSYFSDMTELMKAWLNGTDVFDKDGGPFADRKTLVIDTWTKLNRALLEEAARENPRVADLAKNKATFTEWGLLASRQFAIMDLVTQLCDQRGIDVVITAQPAVLGDEMEEAKKTDDAEGYSQVVGMPSLIGGYKRSFGADVSDLYYLEVIQGATPVRRLWTQPRNSYYAKTRLGLPAYMDNPTYDTIHKAMKI